MFQPLNPMLTKKKYINKINFQNFKNSKHSFVRITEKKSEVRKPLDKKMFCFFLKIKKKKKKTSAPIPHGKQQLHVKFERRMCSRPTCRYRDNCDTDGRPTKFYTMSSADTLKTELKSHLLFKT